MLPLTKHAWNPQLRLTAALTLPHLFEAAVHVPGGAGMALASRIMVEGLQAIVATHMDVRGRAAAVGVQ